MRQSIEVMPIHAMTTWSRDAAQTLLVFLAQARNDREDAGQLPVNDRVSTPLV